MKKNFILLFFAILVIYACKKDNKPLETEQCTYPIPTRVPRTFYDVANQLPEIQYNQSHCGYLPLSKENYWVFQDSVFDDNTGQFISTAIDTLRFNKTFQSNDSIVWWKPNNDFALLKGFYTRMYSTDSVLYALNQGAFGSKQTLKWCYQLNVDSVSDPCIWSDAGRMECVGKKLNSPVVVLAGSFTDCRQFIKIWEGGNIYESRLYIYYKPGLGILRAVFTRGLNGIIIHTANLSSFYIDNG
jgi:hypothetical protein